MADLSATDLDALADRLADRMNLAVVQQVPAEVLAMIHDGTTSVQPFPGAIGCNYLSVRMSRRGNILEVELEANGLRLATFRYEGVARV